MKINFNKRKSYNTMDENYNLHLFFIGLMFLFYALTVINKNFFLDLFVMDYRLISKYQIWRSITYSFLNFSVFELIFSGLALFIFARPLESEIGSLRFLMFYFSMSIIMALTVVILTYLGIPLFYFAGFSMFRDSIFLAYATLYPKNILYIYGILPVPVFVLVLILIATTFFNLLSFGVFSGSLLFLVNIVVTCLYLNFILKMDVRDIFR